MRYLALLLAALTSAEMQAYELAPRLVVNVTIDQLRSDYVEAFSNFYSQYGFCRLLDKGRIYDAASYSFYPIDRASATASIATGTTPYYNGIVGNSWLDRTTLQPIGCVDDGKGSYTADRLRTSTIGDELKLNSNGKALVYSFAADRESAILLAGHAADGAFWIEDGNRWTTSPYYCKSLPKWARDYNDNFEDFEKKKKLYQVNDNVVDMALQAMNATDLGKDDVTDIINVVLSAKKSDNKPGTKWHDDMEAVYHELDYTLGRFVDAVERRMGLSQVLFVVTSTGYSEEPENDVAKFRIPTGTFYINRTASLLNMYLGAIYGSGRYVEQEYNNEIYLNHRLIEQKRITMQELLKRCQEFLLQNAGVADVFTSDRLMSGNNDILKIRAGHNPSLSGDIIINVAPGWRLLNEDTGQTFFSRASVVPFPIIFFGTGIQHERVSTPVTVEQIAPTIAKAIRIRAPNACQEAPLF
jgi:hypothetical protein